MKRLAVIVLLLCGRAGAQKISTLVPRESVSAGNAFQVQYVVTNPSDVSAILPPSFDSLVLVSGPNRYKGSALIDGRQQPIENITYTFLAKRPGIEKIGSIRVQYRSAPEQHDADAYITVLPPARASFHSNSSYTDVNLYAPPSTADRRQLVDQNLFVRALADKKTCYVGEPVTVIFKLYSRLQSTSEVVNVPGLYGFSVVDMLETNRSYPAVETIKGQVFNTSVLRKLQLYPGQAGALSIDGIDLQNDVEFDGPGGQKDIVKKEITSPPLSLLVKPLPGAAPDDYTGAVGRFAINAELPSPTIAVTAAGRLVITIRGAGNFIQFAPPAVSWPAGLTAFEPEVSDSLNVQTVPEAGKRTYTYRFAADSAGIYTVQPISFSFFDPASGRYETVATQALQLKVVPAKRSIFARVTGTHTRKWMIWLIALLALITGLFIWRSRRKKKMAMPVAGPVPDTDGELAALEELPAEQACVGLGKILRKAQREGRIGAHQQAEWQAILDECQLLAYSAAGEPGRREELMEKARKLLVG